jgi:hypothetical protein
MNKILNMIEIRVIPNVTGKLDGHVTNDIVRYQYCEHPEKVLRNRGYSFDEDQNCYIFQDREYSAYAKIIHAECVSK